MIIVFLVRKREGGEWQTAPETHRSYIFGAHVSTYMKHLQENDEEGYERQFKRYIDQGINADSLEKLYASAHKAIRADPNKKRGDMELGFFGTRQKAKPKDYKAGVKAKRFNRSKISLQQRQGRIRQILRARGLENVAD